MGKKPLRERHLSRRFPLILTKKYPFKQKTFWQKRLRERHLSPTTLCFRSFPLFLKRYLNKGETHFLVKKRPCGNATCHQQLVVFVGQSTCHILVPPSSLYPLVIYWSHLRRSIPLLYIGPTFVGLSPCYILVPLSSVYPNAIYWSPLRRSIPMLYIEEETGMDLRKTWKNEPRPRNWQIIDDSGWEFGFLDPTDARNPFKRVPGPPL